MIRISNSCPNCLVLCKLKDRKIERCLISPNVIWSEYELMDIICNYPGATYLVDKNKCSWPLNLFRNTQLSDFDFSLKEQFEKEDVR